ncbi:hypothetical protein E2562_036249, partial [Oryza meyeriana var. granulata]
RYDVVTLPQFRALLLLHHVPSFSWKSGEFTMYSLCFFPQMAEPSTMGFYFEFFFPFTCVATRQGTDFRI